MKGFAGCVFMPHPPIMVPEVGGTESLKVARSINAAAKAAEFLMGESPDTLVLITPHAPGFKDAAGINLSPRLKGNLNAFGHPEVSVAFNNDRQLAEQILKQADRIGVHLILLDDLAAIKYRISLNLDHGAVVPLYFFQKAGFAGQLVHLSVGWMPYEEMYLFGKAVQLAIESEGRRTGVIVSGDLSHRLTPGAPAGYSPNGAEFDRRVVEALAAVDAKALFALEASLIEEAGECGLRPAFFAMGLMDGQEVEGELVSYEGPFGVGYAIVKFIARKLNKRAAQS